MRRACRLERDVVRRIWRGHDPDRSEDVTAVPQPDNYSGSFETTSHSGPWDFLQEVPLMLYGPGHITRNGVIARAASLTDVYPTVGKLLDVRLERRGGRVLQEALEPRGDTPKVVVVVVWDGVGNNVLTRWSGQWPTLVKLQERGTAYAAATVGSSPSNTPATHSTLGTGVFPRRHGITSIEYRNAAGEVVTPFDKGDTGDLELSTFADQIDLSSGNHARVGLLGWRRWHLGMLGHGNSVPEADQDQVAMISPTGRFFSGGRAFAFPDFLREIEGPQAEARRLDGLDGKLDGSWRGRDILAHDDNPAWVEYQARVALEMLRRGAYGEDDIADLFFLNFKTTDIVGHAHSMDSPEMRDVLAAQDQALSEIVGFLEREVEDFVVILTSDHGNTPPAARSGGWPISQSELQRDIDERFDVPRGESLVEATTPVGPFLNHDVMADIGVTSRQVAEFLSDYTIGENAENGKVPPAYESRRTERIFAAAFASKQLPELLRCVR